MEISQNVEVLITSSNYSDTQEANHRQIRPNSHTPNTAFSPSNIERFAEMSL